MAQAATPAFTTMVERLSAEKAPATERHRRLLAERYDLADRPVPGTTMSRGKPVQGGIRVKTPEGFTWDQLAALTPEAVKSQNL